MTRQPICVVDEDQPTFEQDRFAVDVVCAGDSLSGWNNFGSPGCWPFRTYPSFLQQHCQPLDMLVANGGIAGEISGNGMGHVRHYLHLFPNAGFWIVGFGTNDLGTWPDLVSTSRQIIDNLDQMVGLIADRGKQPILFNVPHVNESRFPASIADDAHRKRDYHNERLQQYCSSRSVPLVDICSHLHDQHFGDELHPNQSGARIIADRVFEVLRPLCAT